eukprot:2219300-Prymnesium_polylepis.2
MSHLPSAARRSSSATTRRSLQASAGYRREGNACPLHTSCAPATRRESADTHCLGARGKSCECNRARGCALTLRQTSGVDVVTGVPTSARKSTGRGRNMAHVAHGVH